jgi:integrase/recombinase XerD
MTLYARSTTPSASQITLRGRSRPTSEPKVGGELDEYGRPLDDLVIQSPTPGPPAPVPDEMLSPRARRPRWLVTIPTRPLQFSSLDHFVDRVNKALDDAASVEGLKPSTIKWVKQSFSSFRSFLAGKLSNQRFLDGNVDEQLAVLREWIAAQRNREVSRTTINGRWRAVSALLRWIGDVDGTVNPLRLVPAPRPGRRPPHCLTKDGAERVIEFVRNYEWRSRLEKQRNLVVIGLMVLAGLRRSEVVNLKNGDVDERQGTIIIRDGKGPAGGKTRTCYMAPQLRTLIATYKAERRLEERKTEWFITDVREDRGVTAEPVRDLCSRIAASLGIRLSPHVLRHTYATLLRQAGVPDRVSMDLLGHASLSMLQRYSHVFDGEHLQQASRLILDVAIDAST